MLKLNQEYYIGKVLKRFNMKDVKPITTLLEKYFKLTKGLYHKIKYDKEYMKKVPYALAIGILLYVMVCTRSNIA